MNEEKPEQLRLLTLVGDYILSAGVTGITLSGIARAVGSNNRMLLYYFGSRDALIAAACINVYNRFPIIANMADSLRTDEPIAERLDAVWERIAHPDNAPALRLFFQTFAMASNNSGDTAITLASVVGEWVDTLRFVLVDAGLAPHQAQTLAIQIVALWRGLQMGLLSGTSREALGIAQSTGVRGLLAGATLA